MTNELQVVSKFQVAGFLGVNLKFCRYYTMLSEATRLFHHFSRQVQRSDFFCQCCIDVRKLE